MPTNPERQTKWPRLPWERYPEWRLGWDRPEAEELAERVEELWPREPMPPRVARRLIGIARYLEKLQIPEMASLRSMRDGDREQAERERDAAQAIFDTRWRAKLAKVERALSEVERDIDAVATPARQGVGDADLTRGNSGEFRWVADPLL